MTFNDIDIDCLYSEWHPKVKEFITGFKKEKIYRLLENTETSLFPQQNFSKLVNLHNDRFHKDLYTKILDIKDEISLVDLLKEKDVMVPRDRYIDISSTYQSVLNDNYHPAFLIELDSEIFIIDGRTRLLCSMVINKSLLVRKVTDKTIYEYCR